MTSTLHVLLIGKELEDLAQGPSEQRIEAEEGDVKLDNVVSVADGIAKLPGDYSAILIDETIADTDHLAPFYRLVHSSKDIPILVVAKTGTVPPEAMAFIAGGAQDIVMREHLNIPRLMRQLRFSIARTNRLKEAREGNLVEEIEDLPPPEPAVEEVLMEGYRLCRLLGQGRSSIVFLGEPVDEPTQQVAIKLLRPPSDSCAEELSVWTQQFLEEMAVAPKLKHRHIVQIYDVGINTTSGEPYLVMEYVDGASFDRCKTILGDLSYSDYVTLIRQIAYGLAAIHDEGLCHRDLKPANILVSKEGVVKISDFGISQAPDTELVSGDRMGSPAYMAPEAFTHDQIDQRSDIFSFGVLVYECMLGRRPFTAQLVERLSDQVQNEYPLEPRKIDPEFPVSLQRILARMINKQPDRRYQDITEVIEDLDAFLMDEESVPGRRRGDTGWWRRTWT